MARAKRHVEYANDEHEPHQRSRPGQQRVRWADEGNPTPDLPLHLPFPQRDVPLGFNPNAEDENDEEEAPRHLKVSAVTGEVADNRSSQSTRRACSTLRRHSTTPRPAASRSSRTRRTPGHGTCVASVSFHVRGRADAVCEQTQPTKILISAHAPDSLVKTIDEFCKPVMS